MPTSTSGSRKKKQITKSRTAKPKINPDAKLQPEHIDPPGTKYRCTMCGEFFDKQNGKFYKSSSPLFAGNNGFTSVCKSCAQRYFDYVTEYFSGNEEKALDKLCMILDIYYCDDIAASSKKVNESTSRLSSYIMKANMKQYKDTTYLNTLKDRLSPTIDSYEEIADIESDKPTEERVVTQKTIERWGLGYTPEEYVFLDSHYKLLKGQVPDDDPLKEILIKDMCATKVLQNRAIKKEDIDKYEKLQRSYQTTAEKANLQVKKPIDTDNLNSEESCWGCFIRDVEQYTPADLYKAPKLFEDVDGVKDYFERFIVRPFRNFITGSSDMDEEFSVKAGDDMG